jgi:RNA polymerase sigma factor (sigma-70 family)
MAVTESGHLASREIDDLYRAHVGEVYRYAYAVLGNHADAEDVTQTTFLNAYRALGQGVKPRKPTNWLLTIASNAIKQRFRQEQSRPRQVELDERIAHPGSADEDDDGPSVGELLTALSKIPPQQRQAIVLREFEGRSYGEIAEILGVTTSALETLLFRARRSLAEELQHQLTCTEAQLAISRSVDDRLGRKERRRLRDHLVECPDCARFAHLQQRHRIALRGLALLPIPLSLTLFKGFEGTASAAVLPISGGAGVGAAAVGAGAGVGAGAAGTAGTGGGILAGGLGLKVAAVVAAASVAGGVGVVSSGKLGKQPSTGTPQQTSEKPGVRLGHVAPRGVTVPGNGVARGKTNAPGQNKAGPSAASLRSHSQHAADARAAAHGQTVRAAKRAAATAHEQAAKTKSKTAQSKPTTTATSQGTQPTDAGSAPKKPDPSGHVQGASSADATTSDTTSSADAGGGPKNK